MFHLLNYSDKRLLVQKLQTDRAILILQKPKKVAKRTTKKPKKRQKKTMQFASPELEKAFNLMGKDCQDFILGNN